MRRKPAKNRAGSVINGDCWIIPVKTHAGSPTGTEPANNAALLVTIPGLI